MRPLFELPDVELLDWTSFTPPFYGRGGDQQRVCRMILTDLERIRPDLVMINDCACFALGCVPLLRQLRRVTYITDTLHTNQEASTYISNRRPYLPFLDGVIATSQHVLTRFRRRFPRFKHEMVRYIPYGVPSSGGRRSKRSVGVLRILYVGRIEREQKRVQDLPSILVAAKQRGLVFEFSVVGDGPQKKDLEEELHAAGVAERVTFWGVLPPERVRQMYLEHDVILNVSAYETGPMTIIEAMEAGCVPVTSDIPCIARDAIQHGRNGFLCPVADVGSFAGILTQITTSRLNDLSEQAQASGREFTIERMVDRYLSFLKELSARRETQRWPADPSRLWGRLVNGWVLSRRNPWIPHPHPLKQALRRVRHGLFGGRRAPSDPAVAERGDA